MTKHVGTLALSWGKPGGFYVYRAPGTRRLCLGRVALTWMNVEIEDLMRAYIEEPYFDKNKLRVAQAALRRIIDTYGGVCEEFEVCQHRACNDSYGAWAVADMAWRETVRKPNTSD